MGLGGISIWQLLIVLAIVVMLFGTKRLRTLGSDLGSAVKGFRSSMQDDDGKASDGDETEGPEDVAQARSDAAQSNTNDDTRAS